MRIFKKLNEKRLENLGKPIRDPIRKFSFFNAFFEIIGLACGLRHADWFLPSEIIENLGKPIRDPIRKFSLFNAFFEIIGLACGLRHADWFSPSEIMTFMPQANPLKSGLGNPQAAKC